MDIQTIRRKMRAFNPRPGTSILIEGRRIPVDRLENLPADGSDGIFATDNFIDLAIEGEAIRLYTSCHPLTNRIAENLSPQGMS
jgi:hypothetical protein